MTPGPSIPWRVILVVAVLGFVYLGLRPNRIPPPAWYVDGVAHALLSFGIGLVLYKAFAPGRPLLLALLALAALGGVVELIQAWAPTRVPDVSDFIANLVGVLAAGCVAVWATHRRRSHR